jgi:hypothetical protein
MQLRVSTPNKNYTLKPTREYREYIVGSGEDYDIPLPEVGVTSIPYLKFSYELEENCWYADELDSSSGMFIDGQHITRCPIRSEIRINIAEGIILVVSPLVISPPSLIRETANKIPIISLGFRWFKIGSPDDGVGIRLSQFDLHQTYSIDREKLDRICQKLYDRVYQSVTGGTLREGKVRSLMFRKSTLLHDDSRRYVLVTRDTVHGNRTTVFVRFLGYGDNLYLGLDVYSLGGFNWIRFLLKVLLTGVLFPLFPILWWKLIWRITYERKFGLAFRQEFPGKIGNGPFDYE